MSYDSELKIKTIENNIKKFSEVSNIIYLINTDCYHGILEDSLKKHKNLIVNNKLNEENKKKYLDYNPDLAYTDLQERYESCGIKEDRKIPETKSIYISYVKNSVLSGQAKWYNCLSEIVNKYSKFIVTNDSFILVNSIAPFMKFCKSNNNEMTGLLDSYESKYHYPDFLRYYNKNGIKKWLRFYEVNKYNVKNQLDLMNYIEIDSTNLTTNKNCFYKVNSIFENTKQKNIHYIDSVNEKYLNEYNYPVIKLKKLTFTKYESDLLQMTLIIKNIKVYIVT